MMNDITMLRLNAVNDSDLAGLDALGDEAFSSSPYSGVQWSPLGWAFVIYDGEGEARRIASHVALLVRKCFVGGQPVRVGGIGGVSTLISHRGRGHASALMRAAADHMRSLGLVFGLLQCPDTRITFYQSLGWRSPGAPMFYDQPDGSRHQILKNPMVLELVDQRWPAGEIDMNGTPF